MVTTYPVYQQWARRLHKDQLKKEVAIMISEQKKCSTVK
jgi:hypothetical protein